MSALANYYFIPTLRDGLASCITAPATGKRTSVSAQLTPSADDVPAPSAISKTIELYGPGDVVGLDPSIVVRTDPRRNVGDYEPNYMVTIDLREPDFPWRFTPDVAEDSGRGKLTPWIALIVLKTKGEEFGGLGERKPAEDQKTKLPVRWIEDVKVSALPDPTNAWMWAHVQLSAEGGLSDDDVRDRLNSEDASVDNATSRLICPRRLAPRTQYTAFVIPTFKIGQVALQLATLEANENALTLGWPTPSTASATATIDLPYYYSWDFSTGVRGDFEYLARLLVPRELTTLGRRRMRVSSLEYELPSVERPDAGEDGHVLDVEGALRSPELQPTAWANDRDPKETTQLQIKLAELLNLAATNTSDPPTTATELPPVTPPIYGRWHAGRSMVDPNDRTAWLNHLNLDPRHRVAAGLGALVVEKEQEALMASLWDQMGDIDVANNSLNHGQLGIVASKGILDRLSVMADADFLWLAQPVLKRTAIKPSISSPAVSVNKYVAESRIPSAAFDPAFRRILRRRSGLRKRQRPIPPSDRQKDLLSRLNEGSLAPAGPPPRMGGMQSMCAITDSALENVGRQPVSATSPDGCVGLFARIFGGAQPPLGNPPTPRSNDFCEAAITSRAVIAATTEPGGQPLQEEAGRAVAQALDEWLSPQDVETPHPSQIDLKKVRDVVTRAIDPRVTIAARVSKRIEVGPGIHQRPALGRLESKVEFPQPMYEPLRQISQDWILPGVETVPQNTISLVQTNRRFLEAYMVGLCHAFAGEALWRGAPVYIWTTFFRQFWDVRGCLGPDDDAEPWKDISRLTTWRAASELSSHHPRPSGSPEQAVLLVRGDLLMRYPNTLVYAVETQNNGHPAFAECMPEGATIPPPVRTIFSGVLPPDLVFLGFDKTPSALCKGGPNQKGYYIVLEERLGEPRFGFDIPNDETTMPPPPDSAAWWYDLTWAHLQTDPNVFQPFTENTYITNQTPAGAGSAPVWASSSASIANICLQRPMRIAIHASQMLSDTACG